MNEEKWDSLELLSHFPYLCHWIFCQCLGCNWVKLLCNLFTQGCCCFVLEEGVCLSVMQHKETLFWVSSAILWPCVPECKRGSLQNTKHLRGETATGSSAASRHSSPLLTPAFLQSSYGLFIYLCVCGIVYWYNRILNWDCNTQPFT